MLLIDVSDTFLTTETSGEDVMESLFMGQSKKNLTGERKSDYDYVNACHLQLGGCMKQLQKKLCLLLAIIVLLTWCYATYFITQHIHHDCTGNSQTCAVCQSISMAREYLNRFKHGGVAIAYVLVSLLFLWTYKKSETQSGYTSLSPIQLKVKLLN